MALFMQCNHVTLEEKSKSESLEAAKNPSNHNRQHARASWQCTLSKHACPVQADVWGHLTSQVMQCANLLVDL